MNDLSADVIWLSVLWPLVLVGAVVVGIYEVMRAMERLRWTTT